MRVFRSVNIMSEWKLISGFFCVWLQSVDALDESLHTFCQLTYSS